MKYISMEYNSNFTNFPSNKHIWHFVRSLKGTVISTTKWRAKQNASESFQTFFNSCALNCHRFQPKFSFIESYRNRKVWTLLEPSQQNFTKQTSYNQHEFEKTTSTEKTIPFHNF
jgi:hypothetical protein